MPQAPNGKARTGQKIVTDAQTPGTDQLVQAATAAAKTGGLPPVHLWNPPFCGDIDMEIRRDGTWFHDGTPIGRPALVRLFSTILKREGSRYFLVTPVEKVGIRVEDAPFVAQDFEVTGQGASQSVTFVTNVGDRVVVGADCPIRVERDAEGTPRPYLHVRAGLEALIDRKSFYRLVDLGEPGHIADKGWFGLWSNGVFFPFVPLDELTP
jgi:hypothetical protein